MNKIFYLCMGSCILLFLSIICNALKEPQFSLREGTCGYNKQNRKTCIILTSGDFWVDASGLVEVIEKEKGNIEGCFPCIIFFTVEGNQKDFIERINPKIKQWVKKNYRDYKK